MENLYQIENGKIKISRYKVTYFQHYNSYINEVEAEDSVIAESYFKTEEDAQGFIDRYLSKHKALQYIETIAIDTSAYDWIDGIEIPKEYPIVKKFIKELLEMGEETYLENLTNTSESYMVDLDYRLSLLELGVSEK